MFYDNDYQNLERWRAREKMARSGGMESNRTRHPVEVKTSMSEPEETLYLSQPLTVRKGRCRICIIASSAVVICLIIAAAVVGVFAFANGGQPQSDTVMAAASLGTESNEQDVEFEHWYANQKPDNFEYAKTIQQELRVYFSQARRHGNMKFLKQFFEYHHSHLANCETDSDFLEYLDRIDENKLNFYKSKLKDLKDDLPIRFPDFQDIVTLVEGLKDWYIYLLELDVQLTTYEFQAQEQPIRPIEDCNDFSLVLRTLQSMRNFTCDEEMVQELRRVVEANTNVHTVKYSGDRVELRNRILVMSKVVQSLRDVPMDAMKDIYLFATRLVYLDSDFTIPEGRSHLNGTNLVIISPKWEFMKKISVHLRGRDGEAPYETQAQPGQNGEPGAPGGNGGNFLAVGDYDASALIINMDGGDGGDGQSGADGVDGINGGTPDSDLVDPKCKVMVNQLKNGAGEVIRYYKVYDSRGCGTSGMNGGVAGPGGMGGQAYLLPLGGEVTMFKGNGGAPGAEGSGGHKGVGGKNGCYYQATTINNSHWNRWTWTKCSNDTMPSGADGVDGANAEGLVKLSGPSSPAVFSDALLSFRRFARQTREDGLLEFLNALDERKFVYNLTEHQSLLTEFSTLDQEENRTEIFEAFRRRVETFINLTADPEYKTALKFLRSAVLGKITQMKYGWDNCLITDITTYLDLVISSIDKMDPKTLTKMDDTRSIAREILSAKESELYADISLYFKELNFRRAQLDKRVLLYLSDKEMLEEPDNMQKAYYITLARTLDARAVVDLLMFLGQTLNPLHRISVQTLNDEDTFDSYKKLEALVANREEMKAKNLKDGLAAGNIPAGTFDEALTYVRTSIEGNINITASLRQRSILYLLRLLPDFSEYHGNEDMLERTCIFSRTITLSFQNVESEILGSLKILLAGQGRFSVEHIADYVHLVRDTLNELTKWNDEDIPVGSETVVDKLYELSMVLYSLDAYVGEADEARSLALAESQVKITNVDLYNAVSQLKRYIYTNMAKSQYLKAANAFRQWVFPYGDVYVDLALESDVTAEEAKEKVQELQKKVLEYKSSIASFDKNIREAAFMTNSSVREFYVWPNAEVKDQLTDLFQGKKVTLRADVENIHVLNKSAIKFRTVRLEFRPKRGSAKRGLSAALENFAIEMRHPGYSYYNYKGKTYMIATEAAVLWYSYKQDSAGQPETFNQVYKKLKVGDITLSPYTTWTVQVQQLNFAGSYTDLETYASEVDVVLVGQGSFVAETTDDDTYPSISPSYRPVQQRIILP